MKKVILILIASSIFIMFACRKYEYNKNLKKIYGTYTVTNYTVDGIDSLSLFKDSLSTNFDFYFNETDEMTILKIEGYTTLLKKILVKHGWGLLADNKTLNFHGLYNSIIGTGPFGGKKESTWTIIDLSKNNLIMQTTYNGKQYNIELRK